jgi:cyclic pyranopterin phosphate synthase
MRIRKVEVKLMIDGTGRNIDYFRISVTDRFNLRCVYCIPENGVESLGHEEIPRLD